MNKKRKKSGTGGSTGRERIMKSEFAQLCEVNPSSITKAIQSGAVLADADGLINPSLRINRDYRHDVAVKAAERRALQYARPDVTRTLSEGQRRRPTKKEMIKNLAMLPAFEIEEEINNFPPASLKELKTHTEIKRICMETRDRIGQLITRCIVEERLATMAENIDMFGVIADAVSARICERLGRPDSVEKVKAIIAPEVKKIIQDFKELCQKKI